MKVDIEADTKPPGDAMRRQRHKPAYQRHPSKREVSSYTALLKASAERGDAKAACDLMKLRDAEQMVLQIDD